MEKNMLLHKLYVQSIVRETYPDADFENDLFLIIQTILPVKFEDVGDEADEITCLIDIHYRDSKEYIPLYTVPTHPFYNRDIAMAGHRYASKDRKRLAQATPSTYPYSLLKQDKGKKVSDIGLVIRVKSIKELADIAGVSIIWDYNAGTTTMLYRLTFLPPQPGCNCYFLRSIIPEDWGNGDVRPGVYGGDQSGVYYCQIQPNGDFHHMHYFRDALEAEPLGENLTIAQNSKKFKQYAKKMMDNIEERSAMDGKPGYSVF